MDMLALSSIFGALTSRFFDRRAGWVEIPAIIATARRRIRFRFTPAAG
jgi:hypothetical protein